MNPQLKTTLAIAFSLLALLFTCKMLVPLLPWGHDIASMIILSFQLYVPLWFIRKEGHDYKAYGLYDYGFFSKDNKVDWLNFFADLKRTLYYILATFVPYALLYHFFQVQFASRHAQNLHFNLALPDNFLSLFCINLLIVALPEEIFYRGFLQTRFLKIWPLGKTILLTSLFFALAHFIGENNLLRLLPFFPALVFSTLAYYSKSLMGAIIYHALYNVFSAVLHSSYSWS